MKVNSINKTAPHISVVLPVYNGEKYLNEAINSILTQTFADFEFIIIDDGSTDSSLEILKRYQQEDVRIKVVVQENQNLATTLNNLIELATGEWIARMDQDDIALPHRFERQLDLLERTGADICGTWVKFFGSWDRRTWKTYQSDEAIKIQMLFNSPFAHPTIMMRTDLAKKLKYDKACEKAEDYDLWVRAAQVGWNMVNVPEVLLLYRRHASQITTSSFCKQRHVSEEIQKRYWAHMTKALNLRPDGSREIINLMGLKVRSNMDIVDATFTTLLQQSHPEAKIAVMHNLSRLYLKVAAEYPDIVKRWEMLNSHSNLHAGLCTKLKLYLIRLLKIPHQGNSYDLIKKLHTYIFR
ncbi:glycosyltransferase family 2 protein [Citrifermentans bremense]|uniref:glycosyltransferase family 2 protein n=1 Tax=Citrifermentans bremense TaxID=60035 RepID=UPI0004168CA3|nr:glycosyltransferase [Citrifermentans bremense]